MIEDETPIRENIQAILSLEDFDTLTASDGAKGLLLAKNYCPDLIICDVMLPEIDGYGILQALREDEATANIPLIFLTARTERADCRQGMEMGANDYLTKPFTAVELLRAIATQLEKQAIAKQEANRRLDELRSSIARSLPHELNTPLNGILSISELLLSGYSEMEDSEVLEMLQVIHSSGQRLSRLIQNFLLYAELEIIAATPARVEALQNTVPQVTETLIQEVAVQKAKQYERVFDLQLDLQETIVGVSEQYLDKLISELVDNAFKFSKTGTPVQVNSYTDGRRFNLSVVNIGRGIPAEHLARLGAYVQFERQLYEQQGTGLGLSIAKRITELHGGELLIESIPGLATTLHVRLPQTS